MIKRGIILIIAILTLFLSGCSQTQVKSCGYDVNQMVDITGQIIDTHNLIDTTSKPPTHWTVVTIRTVNCDVFALKESVEYQMTKSEDTDLKVDKICINESSGDVSFKGLYRPYTVDQFTYDITPSFCSKTSEEVAVNITK